MGWEMLEFVTREKGSNRFVRKADQVGLWIVCDQTSASLENALGTDHEFEVNFLVPGFDNERFAKFPNGKESLSVKDPAVYSARECSVPRTHLFESITIGVSKIGG
jgi:hypothetical protein